MAEAPPTFSRATIRSALDVFETRARMQLSAVPSLSAALWRLSG